MAALAMLLVGEFYADLDGSGATGHIALKDDRLRTPYVVMTIPEELMQRPGEIFLSASEAEALAAELYATSARARKRPPL